MPDEGQSVRGTRRLFVHDQHGQRLVGTINHERMLVLLSTELELDTRMTGTPDEAFALIREYPLDKLRMVQAGFEKRDMLAEA